MQKADIEGIDDKVNVEDVAQEQVTQPQKLTELEDSQGKYILDFAKGNYKKIVSPDGKFIKINGEFHKITKIDEDLEEQFSTLENALNTVNPLKPKEKRKALYEFLTFACAISEQELKSTDRGELTIVALILGMMQKGFRHL